MNERQPVNRPLNLLLLLISLAAAVACRQAKAAPVDAPAATTSDGPTTVGLLISTLYNPLYVSFQNGAIEAASQLHFDIMVRDAGNDAERQKKQLVELLSLGVDALVLVPVDAEALVEAVDGASGVGVPVFTVDQRVNSANVRSHVAADSTAGGRMAGNFLAERLRREGAVAELLGNAGVSATLERGKGFLDALSAYDGITIVARQAASFNRREAKKVFAAMLQAHPEIKGVFAHNDEMILGAIDAALEAGRADILFVGFDGGDEAIAAIEAGTLTATIAQQPEEMGRLVMETVASDLRGEAVPAVVGVDLALIAN
jgi:ribose transport system substrate-binding protein